MIRCKNRANYHVYFNKHDNFLIKLAKISQKPEYFQILHDPKRFNDVLLNSIYKAQNHIYLVALYLENDQGGKTIIDAILYTKKIHPNIKIKIVVDWYRAQRNRIGESKYGDTNLNWYKEILQKNPHTDIAIYRIPINISEALGVLHLKGFIIDDTILYSGANINNEYLHTHNKYRRDRYHVIKNKYLSNIMLQYINKELLNSNVVDKLGFKPYSKKIIKYKNSIRLFRKKLRSVQYDYKGNANYNEFSITPLVGLGKNSILNKTIYHLISSVKNKIILCTPYFNVPNFLICNLIYLLRSGKNIEIIVGDKTANDFYNPKQENKPFKLISILPYLYEINLRVFSKKLQNYIDNQQLTIRLWKSGENGYHIKGIWVDKEWQLLTGSNLNPRSLRLDLENALLIHDPLFEKNYQTDLELNTIRMCTKLIYHYSSIEKISDYPYKIKKFIRRIRQIKFDWFINQLL